MNFKTTLYNNIIFKNLNFYIFYRQLAERVHKETLNQLEHDTDREISQLRAQFDDKLKQEKDDKVRLRGQAGIHRKHHEDLRR